MAPSDNDLFKFYPSHPPRFEAGDYQITVELGVTPNPAAAGSGIWDTNPKRTALFSVSGDRFALHPALLRSCYPPPGSLGNYQGVLPHVIFHRSTLPWERSPGSPNDPANPRPWLALLAFKDAEAPDISVKKVADLFSQANLISFQLTQEKGDDPNAAVSVIEVEWSRLRDALPTWGELPYTAHVREVDFREGGKSEVAGDDAGNLDGGNHSEVEVGQVPNSDLCSVVIGQQMVMAGTIAEHWVVHLVSLESAYNAEQHLVTPNPSSSKVQLVSLFHWEFVTKPEEPDFEETISQLKQGDFRLPDRLRPTKTPVRASELMKRGAVPLPHRLREGGTDAAWYHGPLLPWDANSSPSPPVTLHLPARSSDALSIYESELGMLDLSYATAWELGRLTALADRSFSLSLAAWKRTRSRADADFRALHSSGTKNDSSPATKLPKDLRKFLAGLSNLTAVPANHLIPHPEFLPEESIRVVRVDPTWVSCLRDGALSIGRHSAKETTRDAQLKHALTKGSLGVIIRSRLVDLHPEMEIRGATSGKPIPAQSDRKLGSGIRLVLFSEDPDQITIGLPPTVLHYGIKTSNDQKFYVSSRSRASGGKIVIKSYVLTPARFIKCQYSKLGRIYLDRVALRLTNNPQVLNFRLDRLYKPAPPVSTAQLAADLMEGAPLVTFTLQTLTPKKEAQQ